MRRPDKHRGAPRRAALLVELAILLPVTLLLACGIIDLSRFAHHYIALSDAAGTGARFASLHPVTPTTTSYWVAATQQAARDAMQEVPGFRNERLTINGPHLVTGADGAEGQNARLTMTYRFQPFASWPALPREIVLVRRVEMKVVR